MIENMSEYLGRRVCAWERKVRVLRALLGSVVLLLAAVICMAQAPGPDPASAVSASQFKVVDRKGRTLAVFGASAEGAPTLMMLDSEGNVRVAITETKGAVGIQLEGASGSAHLSSDGLDLFDHEGHARAVLSLRGQKAVSLGIYDKTGECRSRLDEEGLTI